MRRYLGSVVEVVHSDLLDQLVGIGGDRDVDLAPPDVFLGVFVEDHSLVLGRASAAKG